MYIYKYKELNIKKIIYFSQKDAHQFADHFASPEMSVRVDFEG